MRIFFMKKQTNSDISLNELVNVKDIKGMYLFTKDGYVMGYLMIHRFNIDLVSRDELEAKTDAVSSSFDGDRKDWVYQSFPREANLDGYKEYLKKEYQSELEDVGKRRILGGMIKEAVNLTTSGENYDHQHYIKIWKKIGSNPTDAMQLLRERLEEFKARYEMMGVRTEILTYEKIVKLCNLYGNASQIPYEPISSNALYTPIPQLKKG